LKQGTASVACDLDLSGAPDCIAVLSGREATVRMMERSIEEVGSDPADWISNFQKRARESVA